MSLRAATQTHILYGKIFVQVNVTFSRFLVITRKYCICVMSSIILIKLDGAVACVCYVLCNEGANDALKLFTGKLTT